MNRQRFTPPRWLIWLLTRLTAPHLQEELLGDLHELFHKRGQRLGYGKAKLWYLLDMLLLVHPRLWRRTAPPVYQSRSPKPHYTQSEPRTSYLQPTMLQNYLKIALRNLKRSPLFSLLNIVGLAVGMAFAMVVGLWVRQELSYDRFHQNQDRIAMIMKHSLANDERVTQSDLPLPLYDELKATYPQAKRLTRLDFGSSRSLKVGENKVNKTGYYADPDFLRIFSFPLLKGNRETALNNLRSIVLTESLSQTLFGSDDPMGRIVRLDNEYDMLVTGVATDVPKNSSLTFDFLVPFEFNIQANESVKRERPRWGNNFVRTIVELQPGISMDAFSSKISPIIRQKTANAKAATLFLHPLPKWHLYGEFKNWVNTGGRIESVRLFAIVGLLVLLVACINFMNLTTARSEKRAREVGVRKAVGSQRFQLIGQFLTESLLTSSLAFGLSLLLVGLLSPFLNELGFEGISLHTISLSEPEFSTTTLLLILTLLGASILTGLLAGSYPALYLSSFAPVKVLKGTFNSGKRAAIPRKILVVTQFTFSIALIISTVIVFQQIRYAKSRPLGYDPNNLISLGATKDLQKNFPILKRDLMSTGLVEAVSKASSPMTAIYSAWTDFSWAGKDPTTDVLLSVITTEFDYEKTAGLKLRQGRAFSPDFPTDSNAVLLNEAAVRTIGFKNPIGQIINFGDQKLTVIGVIENVVMVDPFKPVRPAIILFNPDRVGDISLRLKSGVDVSKALAAIQPIVDRYNPAYPFEYHFVDQEFEKKFAAENQTGKLAGIFAILAIVISCLGLFGLAAYMAERRTKEIGIRKVLGASVGSVWMLLSRDFIGLVLLSCLIASPLAGWLMTGWLEKYAYRIQVSYWVFLITALAAIVITLLTVSFQSIKAALMNPVKSLRSE